MWPVIFHVWIENYTNLPKTKINFFDYFEVISD